MTRTYCNTMEEASTALSLTCASETQHLSHSEPPLHRIANYKPKSSQSSQERRREILLLEQKERRTSAFNGARGLIEDIVTKCLKEDCMEWCHEKAKPKRKKYKSPFSGRLMMSEWMVQMPKDFEELWYMVPCPVGKRTLVVATEGVTKAYSKRGRKVAKFQSALPGGSSEWNSCGNSYTLLDCVWDSESHTYYVLDVLAWNNQPMTECETEFRFFWLRTKLPEMDGIAEVSPSNKYPFLLLTHYACHHETLMTVMATYPCFPDEKLSLDGLLFYHSQAHYTNGICPLVGWLKAFMLEEMLNVPVAKEYMSGQPIDYQDVMHHIAKSVSSKEMKRLLGNCSVSEEMECLESEDPPESDSMAT